MLFRSGKNIIPYLQKKNVKYGDSALHPFEIFGRFFPKSGLGFRMDDKLSRIKNADKLRKNDWSDCIGYLFLMGIDKNWLDLSDQDD